MQSIVATQIHKQGIQDFNFNHAVSFLLRDLIITLLLRNNLQFITVVKTILLSTVLLRCEELARVNAILNYISGCVAKVIRRTRVKAKWNSQFRQWWWWDSRRFVIAKYCGKFKYIWSSDQLIKRSSYLNLISTYSMVLCQLKTFINSNFILMIYLFMYKK